MRWLHFSCYLHIKTGTQKLAQFSMYIQTSFCYGYGMVISEISKALVVAVAHTPPLLLASSGPSSARMASGLEPGGEASP